MPRDKVVHIGEHSDRIPIPVQLVLDEAAEADLERVVLVGRRKDGSLYWHISQNHLGLILLDLEMVKVRLLQSTMSED